MIEPLDIQIDHEEENEDILLAIMSVLHTFDPSEAERKRMAENICFYVFPAGVFGMSFMRSKRSTGIILIAGGKEKTPVELVAHELCHQIEGHQSIRRGTCRRIQWAEDEAEDCCKRIVAIHDKEIKRLLKEEGAATVRELFSKVYPEDIKLTT